MFEPHAAVHFRKTVPEKLGEKCMCTILNSKYLQLIICIFFGKVKTQKGLAQLEGPQMFS